MGNGEIHSIGLMDMEGAAAVHIYTLPFTTGGILDGNGGMI